MVRSADAVLHCVDFGGDGPPALLLHGLCGNGREWSSTAAWLRATHRVFALDQRGHGGSTKGVAMDRASFVGDVIATIESVAKEPVLLAGQSLGGVHAFLAAAQRPDLVRRLVVAEATAWKTAADERPLAAWFRAWPVPFASLDSARAWFETQGLAGDVWIGFLEARIDGYRPQFRFDDMLAAYGELAAPYDFHDVWNELTMPTLVAGAENGAASKAIMREMAAAVPHGSYAEIAGARHDLHLDAPRAWQAALQAFLKR